jgi:DNA-binding IclR family transcriptional regulator
VDPISLKKPPAYGISSVDHALRLASALQLEGGLTVTAAADRLGVARSTAHRLLQMLVYRDFATQGADRVYRPGLLLELAAHSQSETARLRSIAMAHLERLADMVDESVNVSVRAGETTRFIASVERKRSLRVTSREGMVFPLTRTTTGMLFFADLSDTRLKEHLAAGLDDGELTAPDAHHILREARRARRMGFALNLERSERGLVAVGVPIRGADGVLLGGLSVSMPSVRYEEPRLEGFVAVLRAVGADLEADLRR